MRQLIILAAMAMTMLTAAAAEDADSLYARELLQPGTEAPDFTLSAPDGSTHSLSELRGRYVVLDFWASWCPDCRKDVPALKKLYDKYGHVATFVSVSFDEKRDNWVNYVEANDMGWLQLSELKKWKETNVSKLYNVQWIPSMYLIDRHGQIILSTVMIEKIAAKLKELGELR